MGRFSIINVVTLTLKGFLGSRFLLAAFTCSVVCLAGLHAKPLNIKNKWKKSPAQQERIARLYEIAEIEEEKENQKLSTWSELRDALRPSTIWRKSYQLMDKTHSKFSSSLIKRVNWFDGMFGEYKLAEDDPSYFRLKHSFVWEELEGLRYSPRLRAKVYLPNLKKKIKLIVSNDEERILKDEISGNTTPFSRSESDNFFSSALRWTYTKSKKMDIHFDLGVKFRFPVSPYVRARYERLHNINPVWDFFFTETLFAFLNDESGSTTKFHFRRKVGDNKSIGFTTTGTFSDESSGIDWEQSTGLFHQLSDFTTISYHAGISGVTNQDFEHTEINLGINFRQQFLRSWLFYELTPEVGFARLDQWDETVRFTISVEAVLGNYNIYLDKHRKKKK